MTITFKTTETWVICGYKALRDIKLCHIGRHSYSQITQDLNMSDSVEAQENKNKIDKYLLFQHSIHETSLNLLIVLSNCCFLS